jgi:gag-polypeptide of LTR copia-type
MSFNIKLRNNSLHILKLPADREGFVIWKKRLELLIHAQGLYGYLDGTVARPEDPPMRPEGSTSTGEEVSTNEQYVKDLNKYLQEQAVVF